MNPSPTKEEREARAINHTVIAVEPFKLRGRYYSLQAEEIVQNSLLHLLKSPFLCTSLVYFIEYISIASGREKTRTKKHNYNVVVVLIQQTKQTTTK